ncbi:unnamed protein product [Nesidiocoris tenuis]|uniref:Nose resistant-to-fluoxetine protein N-terminal domain-containing protein n=1 Tax=Nesidiocoris tenuis TaxID=355587 RepID=A0A6H5HJ38_9HEMI|nr:unnamed protein product [Nesidiocoris tenuis]
MNSSTTGLVQGEFNSTNPRWFSEYMPEVLSGLNYHGAPGSMCTKQGNLYRQHLDNQTLWAVTSKLAINLVLGKSKDPAIKNKDTIKFALCIPSNCTYQDLQTVLNEQVVPPLESENLNVSLVVKKASCITAGDEGQLDGPALVYGVYVATFAGPAT